MVEHNNSSRYNDNKGKRKHHDTKVDPNKKPKVTCWKCRKPRHLKKNCKAGNVGNKANGSGTKGSGDGFSNSLKGATVHVCKDRCWCKTYELLNDGSILHMRNESTALMHGHGCVDLRLGHVHFKRMQDMSKDGLIPAFDMDTEKCKTCMLTKITKKLFQNVKCKTKVLELIHSDLCDLHATPSLGNKKYFVTFIDDASRFCYRYLLHSKDEALDKFKVFITEVELQQGSLIKRFRTGKGGEYIDTMVVSWILGEAMLTTCYLLNRAVVRLPDPKLKTLGERCIECIFVGYAEHFKAFRSLVNGTEDSGGSVVPEKVTDEGVQQHEPELRKSKSTRDEVSDQHSYCFNVEDDPKTFDKAMKSQNTSRLQMDLQRKLKVDGTIEKFRARLVIQGFKQKSGINYFDTYALVALISTIRLLIAIASIHNLIIHQMDVKTAFLNGELDEEVDVTKEFLSSRFSMKDMGEADVILGIRIKHESNGIEISQSHYIEKEVWFEACSSGAVIQELCGSEGVLGLSNMSY
ncbi:zinc finger, CCHC-type containing protein [Tanacetum coccineum]